MSRFDAAPIFAGGQVFSASAHGNALHALAQGLHDAYLGVALPFGGSYALGSDTGGNYAFTASWTGFLRHKCDQLYYNITADCPVYIAINGTVVITLPGTATGYVDISGLGLAYDQFYPVHVYADAGHMVATVWELSERWGLELPSLLTFVDGQTPTALEWQDLSNYADELANGLTYPVPLVAQLYEKPDGPRAAGVYPFAGTLNMRGNMLAYRLTGHAPWHSSNWGGEGTPDTGDRWTCARLYIDNLLVAKWWAGKNAGGQDGGEFFEQVVNSAERGFEFTFSGAFDLSAYIELTRGADYPVYMVVTDSTTWDTIADVKLEQFYTYPKAGETVAGWTALTAWAHGAYVYGDGGAAAKLKTLRDDLAVLGDVLKHRNYPAQACTDATGMPAFYGVRSRRFLHFQQYAEGTAAALHYTLDGEEREVTLDATYGQWATYDLDGAERLYVGTPYTVTGALCALEDSVA